MADRIRKDVVEAGESYAESEIVCPWCGYEHQDSWELNGGDEGDWEHECHDCEKTFAAQRHVSVSYS
jgi:transposase-like protein